MATVLNRATKQLIKSANGPDYPVELYIHSPNLTAVAGYSEKYWIITGDVVSLMDQSQRDAVDATEAEAERDSLSTNLDRVLKAVVLALNDGTFVPGSGYTGAQLKSIVKAKL